MNATSAPTARPAYAVVVWCDHSHIFTEIPASNGGQPYVQKWSLTEGGLSKALAQMKSLYADSGITGDYQIPLNGLIKSATGINNFSADQRQKARDVLRRLKIT